MYHTRSGRWRDPKWLICWVALVGCGDSPDHVSVSGKVTLDGQPLPKVRVVFLQPSEGPERNFMGVTDAQGQYSLSTLRGDQSGAAPGHYVVTLSTAFATADMKETDPIPKERVPPQYRELEFDVPPEGTSEANFELTSR